MKKLMIVMVAAIVAAPAFAVLNSAWTRKQTEDPRVLRETLSDNFGEAETRIAAIEGGTADIALDDGQIWVGDATDKQAAVAVSGDVTIANDGAVTIADEAVTLSKMDDIATLSVIGRSTAGEGVPEVLEAATDHFVLRRSATALGFGLLVDANIDAAAAIAGSKIDLSAPGAIGGATPAAGTFTTMKANVIMGDPVDVAAVTNGAVLTLSGSVMKIEADEVSTNTVANPSLIGQITVIANVGTNAVTFARETNMKLSAATRELSQYDTLTLLGLSSTEWVEVSSSTDNQ